MIDPEMNWSHHVTHLSTIISRNIGLMNRSKYYLDTRSLKLLYNALVLPYINYCCLVWGFTFPTYIHKIILLQKRAVRIIAKEHRLANTEPLFKELKILTVDAIAKQQLILFMHKKLVTQLPDELDRLFSISRINPGNVTTRNRQQFLEPFTEKLYRTRISKWIGPRIWNMIIAPNYALSTVSELSKSNLKKICYQYFLQQNEIQ